MKRSFEIALMILVLLLLAACAVAVIPLALVIAAGREIATARIRRELREAGLLWRGSGRTSRW